MCWRNFCVSSMVTKKCEKEVKNSPFSNECHFFQKWKQLDFSEENYFNYTKIHKFACDNYNYKQEQPVDPLRIWVE